MSTSGVKLLGSWPSPYVNRAMMALKIKSVEYEFVETYPREKNELLIKNNPAHKKVPVLIHADRPICESLVIVQYIDDAWTNGPSILPSDPYDRAIARFWAAFIDDKWVPLLKVLREKTEIEEGREIKKVSEGLVLLEEAFVSCSKGKVYFGGESIGYLDIVLGSCLGWLIRVTEKLVRVELLDRINTPGLAKWADFIFEDVAVKAVFPDSQRLFELYKKFQALVYKASNS